MAATTNGHINGRAHTETAVAFGRFTDIPGALDIPVSGGEENEAVEVGLEDLPDDPTELCTLLENENVGGGYWITIALAYAKQQKPDLAIDIINKGLSATSRAEQKLGMYNCLCWLFLLKSRQAPRARPEGQADADITIKDDYLRKAVSTLNDASRIHPGYPPLYLARGVLCLLRASIQNDQTEKLDTLRQSLKSFENALNTSKGKDMMAYLGRARAYYSLGKYANALQDYQHVLEHAPDLADPDPRIGIGCCFWQLGHKDEAKMARERAAEVNPDSTIANILLGLYHLNSSSQYATKDPQFAPIYKKAMVQYTQKAFKLDNNLPLACATFGGYFLIRKAMPTVETLARKAIELTDVNAIASDGWYLLARKEHYSDELAKASEYYNKADLARGGDDRGYLPAKFGAIQLRVLQQDFDGAKFRLEKLIQQTKSAEAMTLLGTLFAADAFSTTSGATKEEQTAALKKAIALLEAVRTSWKDPKKNVTPDSAVLINLARLYESENLERSLQCLQQVEQMELDELPEDLRPEGVEDEKVIKAALREYLPPQLLNNIACFHYQAERLSEARELFQTALNACIKVGDKEQTTDTDALVTTISYNLARTYEAENMFDEAKTVYEGLLSRHQDYTDANARLTYINLRQKPESEGPKAMVKLYEAEPTDLEVRSLYGWYMRKAKRKATNIAEDQEQRHHKHTLQNHDKHDRYALTAMGNLYLVTAREMRRDTDTEKDNRHKMYIRAVEFFDKALQLDPQNAYAAQGIGIAMAEDKKDLGVALQIFTKVRETVKDPSVYTNLGHIYCELKQYSRAIEHYEAALAQDRQNDATLLACLARVWLLRGKQEKDAQAMRLSLDFSQRAYEIEKSRPSAQTYRFNVAFVQMQLAQLLHSLSESQRTLSEVEDAAAGLDAAIETLTAVSKSANPPFPRHDIEQRVNMARNTMRKQLERAVQSQKEYEEKNASRLAAAREVREKEMRRREEELAKVKEAEEEKRRLVAEERAKLTERDRALAEMRAEEDRRMDEEFSPDEEGGAGGEAGGKKKSRPKRGMGGGGKRKKKGEDVGSDLDGEESGARGTTATPPADGDAPRKKKKRKLERRGAKEAAPSKFKSSELVGASDDEDDVAAAGGVAREDTAEGGDENMQDAVDEEDVASQPRKKATRVIDEEDEDEDAGDKPSNGVPVGDLFGEEEEE